MSHVGHTECDLHRFAVIASDRRVGYPYRVPVRMTSQMSLQMRLQIPQMPSGSGTPTPEQCTERQAA